jgi:hypothetical protein
VTNVRERLTDLISQTYDDPDLFNSAILGRPPLWGRQREIAQSVVDYRITVAYTGNAIGKDYLLGCLIPWWLFTRSHSLVVVTGPSQTVLGSVTWKEVRRALEPDPANPTAKVPLGVTISQGIKCSPLRLIVDGDWGALGYSTTSVERASGQHNRKLFVIVEEASGVEDEIWDSLDSLKYVRLLAIGNPIRADGRFVQLIRQAGKDRQDGIPPSRACNAIRVSSRESPDAGKWESKVGLADRTWIEASERQYGRHSLWVKSHIDAIIPEVSAECLIPETWLDWAAAQKRLFLPADHPIHATRRISCDLGEGVGRDSSAIIVRDDWGILEVVWGAELGLAQAAQRIADLARKYSVTPEKITYDRVGIGRDFPLHLGRHGLERAVGYAGGGSPASTDFVDLRSEAAWKLRQRLDPGGAADHRQPHAARQDFAIPPGAYWQRLRDELKPLTYHLVGRKTGLLSKKDWSTVLGHSPDLGDALIQSFAFN